MCGFSRFLLLTALVGCSANEGPVMFATEVGDKSHIPAANPDAAPGDANAGGSRDGTPLLGDEEPPATWREHWLDHNQLLKLVDKGDDFALYFDSDMDASTVSWISPYLSHLWKYTKKTYGVPGEKRLYAVFHSGKYLPSGETLYGHAASMFDASHDFRNVVDSTAAASAWSTPMVTGPTWYAGLLLDLCAQGIEGVPSAGLTGYTFHSIYAYDALKAIGMDKDADDWLSALMAVTYDSPRVGTYWFRDWFYPLWQQSGATVFARYFTLLAQHYPKVPRADGRGMTYAPAMNLGEYLHFMSGAAGTDLKSPAIRAFGWTDEHEMELQQAKVNFPAITY